MFNDDNSKEIKELINKESLNKKEVKRSNYLLDLWQTEQEKRELQEWKTRQGNTI